MLVLAIEDRNNNAVSELFLDNYKNLSGFSIVNGVISEFNREYLKIFNLFILSNENEKVKIIDGYEVLKDKNSGFYHFFKDGKEDFNKFLLYNSENVSLNQGDTLNDNHLYGRILIASLCLMITFEYTYVFNTIGKIIKNVNDSATKSYSVTYNYESIDVIENKIFGTISYTFDGVENSYRGFSAKQIKDLIYSSENLNQIEKDFLWNPDLINLVIPYYQNDNFKIISLLRHTGLKIESFTEEERKGSNGYYKYDNVIHLRDYDVKNIEEGNDQCRDAGHEYIHLLQVSSCPIFIRETSAEVMSHEFYLKSSDISKPYSYYDACKYLKILMEIIGSEVIIDSNFNFYSTSLENAVKDCFSEEEYNEFLSIMSLSPFYDNDELENGKYKRLYELLSILYTNKFGEDISNDVVINGILIGNNYNRVYFNDSLRDQEEFVMTGKCFSLEEAIKNGFVVIQLNNLVSKEEYESEKNFQKPRGMSLSLNKEVIKEKIANVSDATLSGGTVFVDLENGTQLVFNYASALNLGFLNAKYYVIERLTFDEYERIKETDKVNSVGVFPTEHYVYDSLNEIVYSYQCERVNVPSLPTKFENVQSRLS